MLNFVKIVVYVPVASADAIRSVMAESGCGHLGNYDSCSFSVRGTGRFRPLKGANPAIGKIDEIESVEEERIESICERSRVGDIERAIREAHPYEEPVIEFFPFLESDAS